MGRGWQKILEFPLAVSCLLIRGLSVYSPLLFPNTNVDIWPGDALKRLQKDGTSSYARAQSRESLALSPSPKEVKSHVYTAMCMGQQSPLPKEKQLPQAAQGFPWTVPGLVTQVAHSTRSAISEKDWAFSLPWT